MLDNKIPSSQIVKESARMEKDYELDFINTDSNSDTHVLKIALRYNQDEDNTQYKIKMQLISSILAYPALEMIWRFAGKEYNMASRVFHRICNKADEIQDYFNRSMAPVSVVAPKLRKATRPIAENRREEDHTQPLDESKKIEGEPDWRKSVYSNRYPNMSAFEKNQMQIFDGNKEEKPNRIKSYVTREKY